MNEYIKDLIYGKKKDSRGEEQGGAHHVVRSADKGGGHVVGGAEDARDAKVPEFDQAGARQEDVLCLEVTVENVVMVQVL